MRRVAELVKSGAIGKLLYYRGRECSGETHSTYSRHKTYAGGGTLIHMTVHPLGFLLSLKEGVPVHSVYADMTSGGSGNLAHPEYDGEDFTLAIVVFSDGSRGLIEGDFITKGGLDDSVEIFGSEGTIKVNFSQGSPIRAFTTKGYGYAMEKVETTVGWSYPMPDERPRGGGDRAFHRVHRCRPRSPVPGRRRRQAEVPPDVEAGYASAREGAARCPGSFLDGAMLAPYDGRSSIIEFRHCGVKERRAAASPAALRGPMRTRLPRSRAPDGRRRRRRRTAGRGPPSRTS